MANFFGESGAFTLVGHHGTFAGQSTGVDPSGGGGGGGGGTFPGFTAHSGHFTMLGHHGMFAGQSTGVDPDPGGGGGGGDPDPGAGDPPVLDVNIDDDDAREIDDVPQVVLTPTDLTLAVGNGVSGETVIFTIDGTTTLDDSVVLNDDGVVSTTVEIPELSIGTHTLRGTGATSGYGETTFYVATAPLSTVEEADDNPTEPIVDHDQIAWRFYDPVPPGREYVFDRNPAKWTNPWQPNFLQHGVTTAPDGNVLAWQGVGRSWNFSATGYIETHAEYLALQFWSNLRRRFFLVDHRGETHYVTIDNFDARARIVPGKPWAHDYTITFVHFYRKTYPEPTE